MKKINSRGFILTETLVVSVFIMILFTMIYNNFFPLIGEYEKRENYDDVDGKYTAYLIKRLIESEDYDINATDIAMMNNWGYIRFNCSNIDDDNHQRSVCIDMVKTLEISGCDNRGDNCDIFITRYKLGVPTGEASPYQNFKDTVRNLKIRRWYEACAQDTRMTTVNYLTEDVAFSDSSSCGSKYFQLCCSNKGLNTCTVPNLNSTNYSSFYSDTTKTEEKDKIAEACAKNINKKVFNSAFKDYLLTLPNYNRPHRTTGATYRVIVVVHHKKDSNDFYSYSNMEVNK